MEDNILSQEYILSLSENPNKIMMIPDLTEFFNDDYAVAIFMSQLLYWTPRSSDPDGWIFKTAKQWKEEIRISKRKLERVVFILTQRGLIETKVKKTKKGDPTVHYRINKDVLIDSYTQFLQNKKIKLHVPLSIEAEQIGSTEIELPEVSKPTDGKCGNDTIESMETELSIVSKPDKGKYENDTIERTEVRLSSIAETTGRDYTQRLPAETTGREYEQRVRAENTPLPSGDSPSTVSLLSEGNNVSEGVIQQIMTQGYGQVIIRRLNRILPDKYQVEKLPPICVSQAVELEEILEPDSLEVYTRWYLDVKEPSEGLTMPFFLSKDMGYQYINVRHRYKQMRAG